MGQAPNMPTIGNISQGNIQYVNNPMQSPQLQSGSIQGSPSQHSPMGTQAQAGKASQSGAGDQTTQVRIPLHSLDACVIVIMILYFFY